MPSLSSSTPARPHIALVGMPGSGKTTLGRQLAAQFGYTFLDLDVAIEARAGRGIPDIFQTEGETYFRQLEADTLRQVLAEPGPLVLSTGGGTPCFHQNMEVLQAACLTIWLAVPVPVLTARLHGSKRAARPLLAAAPTNDLATLETWVHETLAARTRFYAQARLQLPNPTGTLTAALALLRAAGYEAPPPG